MLDGLRAAGCTNLIPAGVNTNSKNTKQYDNIWLRKDQWGYNRYESPNAWSVIRNEPVSDHCLVCATIPYYLM